MQIEIDHGSGFCFGVTTAIKKAEEELEKGKCGWSPMLGQRYDWRVAKTLCNGHVVLDEGVFDSQYHGEAIRFRLPESGEGKENA